MAKEDDINDVFDSIAFSEEKISNDAFQEGFSTGEKEGKVEGYHLGYHRGAEIGAEIGFYKGVVLMLERDKANLPETVASKLITPLQKLCTILENFPRNNTEEVDILSVIENIRAQFKKVSSLAKLNISYSVTPDLSF